jgi:hypothetical protein
MLIYKATNKINGKEYIGKTVTTIRKRRRYGYGNTYFQKALEKYGEKNFKWEVLWNGNCSKSFLNELEKYYIYFYDTYNCGYNLTLGGETEKSKNKISKSLSKRTYLVITPNNNKHIVKNLNKFCKERNLNSGGMYFVANGEWSQYKGYRVGIM